MQTEEAEDHRPTEKQRATTKTHATGTKERRTAIMQHRRRLPGTCKDTEKNGEEEQPYKVDTKINSHFCLIIDRTNAENIL